MSELYLLNGVRIGTNGGERIRKLTLDQLKELVAIEAVLSTPDANIPKLLEEKPAIKRKVVIPWAGFYVINFSRFCHCQKQKRVSD